MQRTLRCILFAASLAAAPAAAATHFGVKTIVVAGSSWVSAAAINNHGTITGYYLDGSNMPQGFIQSGATLIILPPIFSDCSSPCFARPTAINEAGDVVGLAYADEAYGFLWHDGAYVWPSPLQLGGGAAPNIGLNNKGSEFWDVDLGDGGYMSYAGTPDHFTQLMPPGAFASAHSINNEGVVAGTFSPGEEFALFTEKSGVYTTIYPPGSIGISGGFINDHGQVAGFYRDSKGGQRGFVYRAGTYTHFKVPGAPTIVAVNAINNKGRVVGVFTDAAHHEQRVFLFNGTKVSSFGHYPVSDAVQVAINDAGVMVVTDFLEFEAVPVSFRVLCGGDGC